MQILRAKAATVKGLEAVMVYQSAAQRWLGEFRKLALDFKINRTPVTGKSTTVVHRVEQMAARRRNRSSHKGLTTAGAHKSNSQPLTTAQVF